MYSCTQFILECSTYSKFYEMEQFVETVSTAVTERVHYSTSFVDSIKRDWLLRKLLQCNDTLIDFTKISSPLSCPDSIYFSLSLPGPLCGFPTEGRSPRRLLQLRAGLQWSTLAR